jgi:hypothetical protein
MLTVRPCRAKKKVLKKPAPTSGAAATRAAEAKKAAEMRMVAPDPAVMVSSQGQTAAASKAAGAVAGSAGLVAGDVASTSASGVGAAKVDAGWAATQGARDEHQVVPPSTEEERVTAGGNISPAKMKERRTKAARDPARSIERDAPVEEAPSAAAVVRGEGPPGPR